MTIAQRHSGILSEILNESTRKFVPKSTGNRKKQWMTKEILQKMEDRLKVKGINETLYKEKNGEIRRITVRCCSIREQTYLHKYTVHAYFFGKLKNPSLTCVSLLVHVGRLHGHDVIIPERNLHKHHAHHQCERQPK